MTTTTKQETKEQKITYNPNPTYQSLTETEGLNADLEQARIQIATIKKERDQLANKVNELDINIAKKQDQIQAEQKKNENMFQSFEELYNKYLGLYEQISSTIAANSITTGKLAEALVRHKFILPEATQQQ